MQRFANFLPAMLGATIEYYDIALYGYMAPILVNLFLPQFPKPISYFYYFSFEVLAVISQLIGAHYFGKMGDKYGRKKTMVITITGTSTVTFVTCIIPTYDVIGFGASILFVLLRIIQCFFLGGEYNGGAIYCLEQLKNSSNQGLVSGLYCGFTVIGIILASLISYLIHNFNDKYFRLAYIVSLFFGLLVYFLRKNIKESHEYLNNKSLTKRNYGLRHYILLVTAALFFGVLYGLPTRIFNVMLPAMIHISTKDIMLINTLVLIIYLIFLIIFGRVSDKFGIENTMIIALWLVFITAIPLIILINYKNIYGIIVAKVIFALLTALFIAPFHAFAQNLFYVKNRYHNISICYATGKIGSTLILALSILILKIYESLFVVSFILIFCSLISLIAFYGKIKFNKSS